MPIRSITPTPSEPVQLRPSTQMSIWDAVNAMRSKGSSTLSTREGVRIFSLREPEGAASPPAGNSQVRERLSQKNQMIPVSGWAPVVTWSPPTSLDPDQFLVDAAFDGTILEVGIESFVARLTNKIDPKDIQEDAEFAFSEVPKADQSLIARGAMFYWFIGKTEKPHGQQSNTSLLRFRRLPTWTDADIASAQTRASFLRALLPLDAVNDET